MKKTLDIIIKLLGDNISKIICALCDVIKSFFSYKKTSIESKKVENENKREEKYCKKVDDVTKNGTLEDLLDLKR